MTATSTTVTSATATSAIKKLDMVHMLRKIQRTHFFLQGSGFSLTMAVVDENELKKAENEVELVFA